MMAPSGGKGFFFSHQAMCGFMSGIFIGLILTSFARFMTPDIWQPKYPAATIIACLLLMLGLVAHFIVNGHLRLIADEPKVKEAYDFRPSKRQTNIVRFMFWMLLVLGIWLGLVAQIDLFFWPA